ncbi:MAG TPA: hypothetical protein VKE22_21655 [Haliangiales bacterium]|nr:hypothetical protein [Haliangiales bacterium]
MGIADNPFYILGLRPGATRAEIEQEGQKLLGMLALGLAAARTYDTPLGPRPRGEDAVRQALAALRDPDRRVQAELWARLPPEPVAAPARRGFDALAALGWRK